MNETLKEKIRQNTEHYYRDTLGLPDWSARIQGRLERRYEAHMFQRLLKFAGPLEGKSVLDLGCGWGGVVIEAAGPASVSVGVEPDEERLAIARDLLHEVGSDKAKLLQGIGEQLPFADSTFDVIASYQVFEHVQDPAKVMAEVARVLKPGGVFHFSTPNYMAFWEPHYKVFWLPLLPKTLGRLYLKLRKRNAGFLGHINYVNPLSMRRLLRRHGLTFTDLRHEHVIRKLEQAANKCLSWLPGWKSLASLLRPFAAQLVFLSHTCFLNQDQEYLVTKA